MAKGCIAGKLAAVDTVFDMATRYSVSSLVCESDAEMEMQHLDQQERLRALLRVSPSALNPETISKLSASAAWVLNEESFRNDYYRLVEGQWVVGDQFKAEQWIQWTKMLTESLCAHLVEARCDIHKNTASSSKPCATGA